MKEHSASAASGNEADYDALTAVVKHSNKKMTDAAKVAALKKVMVLAPAAESQRQLVKDFMQLTLQASYSRAFPGETDETSATWAENLVSRL